MTKLALALLMVALAGCATAPAPPPVACGAGGEVVNFPPGAIPGVAGKMPVNVGLGAPCPK